MDPSKTPLISKELLEFLEGIYQDRSPDLAKTMDTIRYESGQVSVVRYLRKAYSNQLQKLTQKT